MGSSSCDSAHRLSDDEDPDGSYRKGGRRPSLLHAQREGTGRHVQGNSGLRRAVPQAGHTVHRVRAGEEGGVAEEEYGSRGRRRKESGEGRRGGGEREGESLAASEAFLLGMVARTVATIAVFPYLRAKVMLQSTHADRKDASGGAVGIPAMILEMYNEGGLSEVFQGIGPELTRGVFSAALMMMAKEKIGVVVSALVEAHQGRR